MNSRTLLFAPLVACPCLPVLVLLAHAVAATPVPIMLAGSHRALRVDCEQQPATPEGQPPLFRYSIHSMDWEGQQKQHHHFCSTHCYSQGYANGGTLVLTNSGAKNEDIMSLAVIDSGKGNVLEHELLFDISEHSSGGRVLWDGFDEQGNPASGTYSYMDWHGAPGLNSLHGWSSWGTHIGLRLGTHDPNRCPVSWSYDRATGNASLSLSQRGKDAPLLTQRSRRLPLVAAGSSEAELPALSPLPADAPAEAAAVRRFIAGHPALLFGRLSVPNEDKERLELHVHPSIQATAREVWLTLEDTSESKLTQATEHARGNLFVLLRYRHGELCMLDKERLLGCLLMIQDEDILPLPGGMDSLQQLLNALPELREDLPLTPAP